MYLSPVLPEVYLSSKYYPILWYNFNCLVYKYFYLCNI